MLGHVIDWRHFYAQRATSAVEAWTVLLSAQHGIPSSIDSAAQGSSSRMLSGLSGRKSIFRGLWSLDTPYFWLSSWWAGSKEVIKMVSYSVAQAGLELTVQPRMVLNLWLWMRTPGKKLCLQSPVLWRGWNWHVAGPEPDSFFLLPGIAIPCPPSSELTSCDW